jgi:hypothetical protein
LWLEKSNRNKNPGEAQKLKKEWLALHQKTKKRTKGERRKKGKGQRGKKEKKKGERNEEKKSLKTEGKKN